MDGDRGGRLERPRGHRSGRHRGSHADVPSARGAAGSFRRRSRIRARGRRPGDWRSRQPITWTELETLKTIPVAMPQIGEEEKRAVMDVLGSGQLAQGPVVEQFERE